jgi:hypothetical protein
LGRREEMQRKGRPRKDRSRSRWPRKREPA